MMSSSNGIALIEKKGIKLDAMRGRPREAGRAGLPLTIAVDARRQ